MSGLLARLLLVVVDREPLVVRSDEYIEEAPCPPREEPQALALVRRDALGARGRSPAHGARDLWREEPDRQERPRGDERRRP